MSAAAAGHSHGHPSMLTNGTPTHQTQYMWNLSPSNQSCAMSQYLRSTSAAYLPPTPDTPSSQPVTDHTTHSYQDTHAQPNQVDNASSSFHSPARDTRTSWSPLTPPPLWGVREKGIQSFSFWYSIDSETRTMSLMASGVTRFFWYRDLYHQSPHVMF